MTELTTLSTTLGTTLAAVGGPVVAGGVVLGVYVAWLRPREARRSLLVVVGAVRRSLEADLDRGTLPAGDVEVRRFARLLAAIVRDPGRWADALGAGPETGTRMLTKPQRRRLQRYVRTVETELTRYARRARWGGDTVPAGVAAAVEAAVPAEIRIPDQRDPRRAGARWTPNPFLLLDDRAPAARPRGG
jgi:hypothetical protein